MISYAPRRSTLRSVEAMRDYSSCRPNRARSRKPLVSRRVSSARTTAERHSERGDEFCGTAGVCRQWHEFLRLAAPCQTGRLLASHVSVLPRLDGTSLIGHTFGPPTGMGSRLQSTASDGLLVQLILVDPAVF